MSKAPNADRLTIGKTVWLGLLAVMSAVTVGLGMFLTRLIKISANKNADHC
ncbi:hypothetical protein [Pseudomonas fluorescens]